MTITKVALHLLYSSMKKKLRRIQSIFDIEKWLWMSEFCWFRPSILKRPKGQKYFMAIFVVFSLTLNSAACRKITLGTLRASTVHCSGHDAPFYSHSKCHLQYTKSTRLMIPYEHISGAWGRAIVYGLCHSKNAFNLIETCQSCGALVWVVKFQVLL